MNKFNVYMYDTHTLDSNVFVITNREINFKDIPEYHLFGGIPDLIAEDVDENFLKNFIYTKQSVERDSKNDLLTGGYTIVSIQSNCISKPRPNYLTVGDLRNIYIRMGK